MVRLGVGGMCRVYRVVGGWWCVEAHAQRQTHARAAFAFFFWGCGVVVVACFVNSSCMPTRCMARSWSVSRRRSVAWRSCLSSALIRSTQGGIVSDQGLVCHFERAVLSACTCARVHRSFSRVALAGSSACLVGPDLEQRVPGSRAQADAVVAHAQTAHTVLVANQ